MSLNYLDYLSNSGYKSDNQARKDFGENLLLAFKQKNISEGIQWWQAEHLHARIKDWEITYPTAAQFPHPAYIVVADQLAGKKKSVDLVNQMVVSGDIETACFAIMFGQPDDMTSPEHWITVERKQWLVDQMKGWLGWP